VSPALTDASAAVFRASGDADCGEVSASTAARRIAGDADCSEVSSGVSSAVSSAAFSVLAAPSCSSHHTSWVHAKPRHVAHAPHGTAATTELRQHPSLTPSGTQMD